MNEILFFTFAFFCLSLVLLAFRYGKMYLFLLISIFTILMNIFVLKQFNLFNFAITGGNILYGSLFLITDILSEHYGKKEAFRAVMVGFLTSIFFVIALQFLLAFAPNSTDFTQDSLKTLFSVSPRILFVSMFAYLVAKSTYVYLYTRIKKISKEKFL